MNKTQEDIVNILNIRTGIENKKFFRVLTIYKFCQIASMMRAKISFANTNNIPINVYALNLAESGFSKGKSVNILNQDIFKEFENEFKHNIFKDEIIEDKIRYDCQKEFEKYGGDDTETRYYKKKQDLNACSRFMYEFPISTTEGLRSLRNRLSISGLGSTNMKTDEIGSMLSNKDIKEVLDFNLEVYDMGLGNNKLLKVESKGEATNSVPSNMLLFGTPERLFDSDSTEKLFMDFLITGYGRRLLFGYEKEINMKSISPEKRWEELSSTHLREEQLYLSKKFKDLCKIDNLNKEYILDEETTIELFKYEELCKDRASKMKSYETIKKAEMNHRYWKALKIAGAYAFIENSDEITSEHIEDAIELVEESGESFNEMMKTDAPYVRLAKYIAETDIKITQVDLVENLPFYKGSESNKRDLMELAIAYGYQNNIIISQTVENGITFFKGETLKDTNINNMIISYSEDIAKNYQNKLAPFNKLHNLINQKKYNFCSHHFIDGHRCSENAKQEFNLLVLDIDKGLNIDTFKSLMGDYAYLLYTTKRHKTTEIINGKKIIHGDRYRVIFPMANILKMKPDEYSTFMKNVFNWLPFEVDIQTSDIARKWECNNGEYFYNEGKLFPCMNFIPNTKKHRDMNDKENKLRNMDSLEKWFVRNMENGNRNNMLLRYGMSLLDKGFNSEMIELSLIGLNEKLDSPLDIGEIKGTIMRSIVKEETKRGEI